MDTVSLEVSSEKSVRPKKSGSENRQRQKYFNVRLSDDERAELTRRAELVGLNDADYFRQMCLANPPLRKSRRSTPDVQAILKLLARINKLGGNINQIAARLNAGGFAGLPILREAALDVQAMRQAAVKVLSRQADNHDKS